MKLITILICGLGLLTSMAEQSYAQKTRLTFSMKDVSIKSVLEHIEYNSEFSFMYENSVIDVNRKVDINAKDETIDVILDKLFGNEIGYRIIGRHVIMFPGENAPLKINKNRFLSLQQQRSVSGKVTDTGGQPLPGVSIIIKGTTQGTVTVANGEYSITNLPADATLVFSFIGMKTQEVIVGNQTNINITMLEDVIGIEEVVAIGYGVQKKINLTGSVSTIENRELVQVPIASTTQALAGRLPGIISKQSEGKPGTTPTISIRGFGTPLVIVDGIEQENYHNIDPNEIESFSILKDASAAIYGARAGNGVILINTKRGKTGRPRITFNNSVSVQRPTVYPEFVDSWEYAIIRNEALDFAGLPSEYSDDEIQKFKTGTDPNYPNSDYYGATVKDWSLMETNNLNVTGGTENVNYFVSLAYLFQDGIYRSDGVNLNRYNVRSNVDITVIDNLFVGFDLSTRNTVNHDVPVTSHDIFQTIGTSTNRFPTSYPDPDKIPFVDRASHNPLLKINPDYVGYNNTNRQYMTGTVTLKYNIPFIKGLNLQIKGNYVGDQSFNKKWTKPYSTYFYDRQNNTYTIAATGGKFSLTEKTDRAQELTFQGFIEFENTFDDHSIKALFVSEAIDTKSNWFDAYKDGFISGALDQLFAGSSENMSTNGSAFEESRMSYAGRLNYSYKSKYLCEGTLRYDGSSRFASDHRWALFPSLSFGWRISEEKFIKENASFIDNLKLRLSYSHTGYDRNAGAYQYLSTYSFNTQYVLGNPIKTIESGGIVNPAISWEEIYTYNSGLDIDLWNGLLGTELDVFYRLRDGVLGSRVLTLPSTFGATFPQENINKLDDRGLELVVKHRNRIKEFNYSLSANVSWARSKYVEYAERSYEDPDQERLYKRTGRWTNRWFGYKTEGFFQTQEEINNSSIDYDQKGNSTLKPGMMKYVDVNNDKVINWRDQVELGRGSTPDIMFGLNMDLYYKGFDFNMLWQGAAEFNIEFSQNMRTLTINHVWNSYKFLYDGRWTPDNPNATFPRTTYGNHSYYNRPSDIWVKPGDYLRLKNFSIGYTLPKNLVNKINFNNIRIYLAGYNALTIDRLGKFAFDPEGIGNSWTYPVYKSFSLGLNITI